MDNFYLLPLENKNIGSENFLYSEDYILVENKLCINDKVIKLEEEIRIFIAYKYDFLFIDRENSFFTINKYTHERNDIGRIESKIFGISKSKCEKYTIIITEDDILLFDTYFELIREQKYRFDNFVQVGWSGNTVFFVVTREILFFFDTDLNLLGSNKDYVFKFVTYREKYNIFLAATNKGIVSLESSGLIHGECINVDCTQLGFVNDDVLYTYDVSSGFLKIMYSKNFYWYTKQTINIGKTLVDIKGNTLIFSEQKIISSYLLLKETCSFFNNFLVVDDKSILHTNIEKYKIPPPFYLSKIEIGQSIRNISILGNHFTVLLKEKIFYFEIKANHEISFVKRVDLSDEFDHCTLFSNHILLIKCNNILIKVILDDVDNLEITTPLNDLVSYETLIEIDGEEIRCHKKSEIINSELLVVKIYNFNEIPVMLFSNGYLLYQEFYINLKIDFTKDFSICVNDIKKTIYILQNFNLSIARFIYDTSKKDFKLYKTLKGKSVESKVLSLNYEAKSEVFERIKLEQHLIKEVISFVESEFMFAWNNNNHICILTEDKEYVAYLDPHFKLLGSTNLEIFGETRQGTLETFFPKAFSDIWIKKLISEEKYVEAMNIAYKYGISLSSFFYEKINMEKFVKCSNKHILSFVDEMVKIFSDYRIILDSEYILLLRDSWYRNINSESEDIFSHLETGCIQEDFIFLTQLQEEIYSKYKNIFDTEKFLKSYFEKSCTISNIKLGNMINKIKIESSYAEKLLSNSSLTKEKENLDLCRKVKFLNAFLFHLDKRAHFEIILYILVKFKRTDLAIKFCILDLERGVKYIMSITTPEDMKKSVISLFDPQLIIDVYRICQQDSSDIISFINEQEEGNLRFKLCDLIEDRKNALFFMHLKSKIVLNDGSSLDNIDVDVREEVSLILDKISQDSTAKLSLEEERYIKKYKLFEEAYFLSKLKLNESKEKLYLELYACNTDFERAERIFKSINYNRRLLILYIVNDKYEKAIEEIKILSPGDETKLCYIFIRKMKNKYKDIGIIYEKYLDIKDEALLNYLKGKSFVDVIRLFDERHLQQITNQSMNFMRNDLIILETLVAKYHKYRDRLRVIEDRGDEFMSETTSFNYTVTSYKTRGRPGGIYEKEFVLEKLRDIGINICKWRESAENLISIFKKIDRKDCIENIIEHFEKIKKEMTFEYDKLFEDNDYCVFDPNRPRIEKPDISK